MIPFFPSRTGQVTRMGSRRVLLAGIGAASLLAAAAATAAPPPYPQAVTDSEAAARAVLSRAGRESCLRGKLTRALLGLSDSCEASGSRNPLCALAHTAVVVTPMSLAFMDETSRQMLELIRPAPAAPHAAASASAPEAAGPPTEP